MTKAYVQTVGRAAYVWGWTLVNFSNRYAGASKAADAWHLEANQRSRSNRLSL